ncbi:MAG: HEAT repeat domain-containing protein [Polyangiales bacterium]
MRRSGVVVGRASRATGRAGRAAATWLMLGLLWPAASRADDWSLERPAPRKASARTKAAPSDTQPGVLRERYLHVLSSDPTQSFALDRLLALYRERDGNLDGLARELAERPEGAQTHALWMLRAEVEVARSNRDAARAAFGRAAELAPRSAAPLRALASLEQQASDFARAAALLQAALKLSRDPMERAQILRQVGELALDQSDWEGAERAFDAIAAETKGASVFQRAEHARALVARGQHARAAAAYRKLIEALRGDDRVLPPLLLELGRAELEASDGDAALAALDRGRKLAPAGSGVRHELEEATLDAYRRLGRLPDLAHKLELEAAAGFAADRQALLGRLYEELGDAPRALAALRGALEREPGRAELRERVIRILYAQGELGQAVTEYRALVARAPREPRYVLELAKLLLESGKRQEALLLLEQTERRASREPRALRALFELYSRWGEHARATAVLSQLARVEPEDPTHLVALGEQALERGDQAAALALFRHILDVVSDKARAHATLAATYLDHDMPERALPEYETAVRAAPDDLEIVRGLAETLEKLHRPSDAAERWEQVLTLSKDRVQRREARRRVVRSWLAAGQLEQRIATLAAGFEPASALPGRAPVKPDVEAGRFLAECYRALGGGRRRTSGDARYLELAEQALARVLVLEPGDVESLLALERLRALRGNLAGAIEVLSRLLEADPSNAQTYLARMAEHSLALYRDADALGYAERLVAASPSDAKAHERLGDLYRARQNATAARASYARALALDPNAFGVALELAELELAAGHGVEADALLLRVVRASPDDELVKRAARLAIQQGLGTARLLALEQTLLPLALGGAKRPVYRALLVELYDAIAQPLIEETHEAPSRAERARAELAALGRRAIAPLLEALADDDEAQRRIAIELLGQLHNENAATALLAAAEHEGDTLLRRRALLAAAALAPSALAPRFAVLARAPERRLRDAAAFALARSASPATLSLLRGLLSSNTPAVRAQVVLGLGRLRDKGSLESFRDALRGDPSAYVRGAAALALGASGAGAPASQAALATALRAEQAKTSAAVALALGLLGDRAAEEPLCEALFATDATLRRSALWALRMLATAGSEKRASFPDWPEPDERTSLDPLLSSFLSREPATSAPAALAAVARELEGAAEAAMQGPPPGARQVLALLSGEDPLFELDADPGLRATLVAALEPSIAALLVHPDAATRALAMRLLAASREQQAARTVARALEDGDEQIRTAALDGVGPGSVTGAALEQVAAIAAKDPRWWLRLRAVQALGRAGGEAATARLIGVLRHERYAYVREAAAAALGGVQTADAVAGLAESLRGDPEPRVRVAAARALAATGGPAAAQALGTMDAPTRAAVEVDARSRN